VELFLDPGATGRDSWELVVNSRGAYVDNGPDQDQDWNPQWHRAAHVGEGSWSVEMAIPFAAVGASPKPGDLWGINFCRNRQVKPAEGSAWSQAHSFHDASRYGRLRFVGPPETP
jgi:hypothetical protein